MVSVPAGSNSHAWPISDRAARVARITSGLVEVLIAAPQQAISAGIMIALVLPLRGGPRIITALSGSAVTQPPYSSDTEIGAAAEAHAAFAGACRRADPFRSAGAAGGLSRVESRPAERGA